ncbi:hypothetical protein ON058_04205 [Demequina sp. B12]|uniref:SCO4848 family membrane protein n=1 Tax=Demequina sp. B12 TaxID=2992757 RepID=UPI00237A8567|nr:hypothetical protein [Demequina sp. B12]MDE0572614.1 hypothetical protein [Demequina sp. B12]
MTIVLSILLLTNAAFAFMVWPPFMKRIAGDERSTDAEGNRTQYYKVHRKLILMAYVLAGLSGVGGAVGFILG